MPTSSHPTGTDITIGTSGPLVTLAGGPGLIIRAGVNRVFTAEQARDLADRLTNAARAADDWFTCPRSHSDLAIHRHNAGLDTPEEGGAIV